MDRRPLIIPRRKKPEIDEPIPRIYAAIDNDLARDNLEIHLPASDVADLRDDSPGASGEDF